ncbi:MAG: M15 family metallopeptidase [Clostridia bacterium]|nr:M15 family metallopeptidase [Clostridia bacterium]
MAKRRTRRQQAILRRNLFLAACTLVLVLFIILICATCKLVSKSFGKKAQNESSKAGNVINGTVEDTRPQMVTRGNYELDAKYTNLLLVNGQNPLPDDYDYEKDLTTIDDRYREPGYDLNQINAVVYPYLKAMCEAAEADGVHLAVCSPYRSYQTQQTLFERQVQKRIAEGLPRDQAEEAAATLVARPGTSEHHTGLACDFIKANDGFELEPAFAWLQQHAAEYGFIMRYPKEKQEQTGVVYESWHYRFVGIYKADEIKQTGLCLEEYLEQYGS